MMSIAMLVLAGVMMAGMFLGMSRMHKGHEDRKEDHQEQSQVEIPPQEQQETPADPSMRENEHDHEQDKDRE